MKTGTEKVHMRRWLALFAVLILCVAPLATPNWRRLGVRQSRVRDAVEA